VPKRDPNELWGEIPPFTKRKVERILKRQQVAFLQCFLADLMVIQEAYREGWDDLDEHIESMIATFESNLPKRYRRKPTTAEVLYFPTHKRGQK
jgi:hypothetical protein